MANKAVVMIGNLNDGFTPVGPFDDWDTACEWADKNIAESNTWIMTVYSPEDYFLMLEVSTN